MGKYLEWSPVVSPWERLFKAPLSPGGKWVSACFSQVICFKNCQVGSKMEQTTYTPWPPNPSNPPPSGSFLPPRGSASLVLNGPALLRAVWWNSETRLNLWCCLGMPNWSQISQRCLYLVKKTKNVIWDHHLEYGRHMWTCPKWNTKHQTTKHVNIYHVPVCVYLVPVDFDMIHQALKYGSYLKPPAATHFDESWTLQTPHVGRRPWSRNIPCVSWRWGKVANSWQHSQEKWREYAFK